MRLAVYLRHDAKQSTLQAYADTVIPALAETTATPALSGPSVGYAATLRLTPP